MSTNLNFHELLLRLDEVTPNRGGAWIRDCFVGDLMTAGPANVNSNPMARLLLGYNGSGPLARLAATADVNDLTPADVRALIKKLELYKEDLLALISCTQAFRDDIIEQRKRLPKPHLMLIHSDGRSEARGPFSSAKLRHADAKQLRLKYATTVFYDYEVSPSGPSAMRPHDFESNGR